MTTSADETALLAAILSQPDEDTPRLVYADWLDEDGGTVECYRCRPDPDLPDKVPGQVFAGWWRGWHLCPECGGSTRVSNCRAARAEFIRVQVELARLRACWSHPTDPSCPACGGGGGKGDPTRHKSDCPGLALVDRERELWRRDETDEWFDWTGLAGFGLDNAPSPDEMTGVVRRGFVESLTLGADDLHLLDAIRRAHPVTRVVLTTTPEVGEFGSRSRPNGPNEYLYCLGDTAPADDDPAAIWMERHAGERAICEAVLRLRWRGVAFDLPPAAGCSGGPINRPRSIVTPDGVHCPQCPSLFPRFLPRPPAGQGLPCHAARHRRGSGCTR